MARPSAPQIDYRTDFPNGIFVDMLLLIAWLFTDECSVKLNPARQLACRMPGCIEGARGLFQDD
jgi:hypothetical protein